MPKFNEDFLKTFTFREVLNSVSKRYEGLTAYKIYGLDTSVSYVDLKRKADSLSYFLFSKGFKPNDKVALMSDNCPNWMISYFAITQISLTAVPILCEFSKDEVLQILSSSQAKAVIVSTKYFEKINSYINSNDCLLIRMEDLHLIQKDQISNLTSLSDHKIISSVDTLSLFGKSDEKQKEEFNIFYNEANPSENTLASLIFTSGTTGKSKAVMLSHKNLVFNAYESRSLFVNIYPKDRVLSILPLAHTYEFTTIQILTLLCGSCIYFLSSPPAVSILLKAFRDVKPHIMNTVPLIIEKIYKKSIKPQLEKNKKIKFLVNFPLTRSFTYRMIGKKLVKTMGGSMKFFGIGGASLDKEVENFLYKSHFPYALGYGLTETSPLIAASGPNTGWKYSFIGKPLKSLEVKLKDVNQSTGVGEVLVKGPSVMQGYYKDPELTKESFTEDGFYKTGDLALFDSKGNLSFQGRIKNVIIGPSGENIYPENIESIINNQDFVEESLVVQTQKGLCALVKFNTEALCDSISNTAKNCKDLTFNYMKQLLKLTNEKLSLSSKLSSMKIQLEPFVKTPTKKIKRFLYTDITKLPGEICFA